MVMAKIRYKYENFHSHTCKLIYNWQVLMRCNILFCDTVCELSPKNYFDLYYEPGYIN